MNENQLPPGDRTEGPETPQPGLPAVASGARVVKPHDDELRGRVLRFLDGSLFLWQEGLRGTEREVTRRKLAAEIGLSVPVLTEWLNGKYTGNVDGLERRLRAVLRAAERRLLLGVKTTGCPSANAVRHALNVIRRSNQIGLITGPAGAGKSRGCEWYVDPNNPEGNPGAILVGASPWTNMWSLGGAIMECVGRGAFEAYVRGRKPRPTVWDWICQALTGSNRLLIVDEAHLLGRDSINALRRLYDEAALPIALVGNRELLERFDGNEQWFSRVGFRQEIQVQEPRELVKHMLVEIVPESRGELVNEAVALVRESGHFRTLEKVLQLGVSLRESQPGVPWLTIFSDARAAVQRDPEAAPGRRVRR